MTLRPIVPREPELLLATEVARMFGVSPKTVTRWSDTGRLRAIRTPGGHRRYLAVDVRALYEQSQGR